MGTSCSCSKEDTDGPDPRFEGPVSGKKRRPKDIICLAVFIIFICGMIGIGIYAFISGNPYRLLYSVDSKGRLCGVDSGVEDKPNLVFFDITRCLSVLTPGEIIGFLQAGQVDFSAIFSCPTQQVCVATCPDQTTVGVTANPICIDGVDTSSFNEITALSGVMLAQHIADEQCAPYYIKSTSIAYRCIPTFIDVQDISNTIFNASGNTSTEGLSIEEYKNYLSNLTLSEIIDGAYVTTTLLVIRQLFVDILADFALAWPGLIIGFVATVIIAFLYVVLLCVIAPVIIWGGIFLSLIIVAGVSAICWYQFAIYNTGQEDSRFNLQDVLSVSSVANSNSTMVLSDDEAAKLTIQTYISDLINSNPYIRETWLAAAILVTILLLILLVIIIALRKAIQISIKMIQQASKAVWKLPSTLCYPLVTWILLFITVAWFAVVAVFLYTTSEPRYVYSLSTERTLGSSWNITFKNGSSFLLNNETFCDNNDEAFGNGSASVTASANNMTMASHLYCNFQQFFVPDLLIILHVYNLFGVLWVANFWLAFGETVLAGAFAKWYWTFDKKDVPWFAIVGAFFRTLLFHVGTISFGALIIAIIQFIRAVLAYVSKKLKEQHTNEVIKKIVTAILCLMQCCLWCLEKILRYINRQIYVMVAIYGYDFFTSACKVIRLLVANIEKVIVKDRVVTFLLFLGKICIVGLVGVVSYLIFGNYLRDNGIFIFPQPLNYFFIPIMLLMFIAYIVASAFTSVFHMAVDTIFICFLDDLHRNNGVDKPYFMSKGLRKLMGVSNKVKPGDVSLEEVDGQNGEPEPTDT